MGGVGGSAHHDKIVGFDIIICIVLSFPKIILSFYKLLTQSTLLQTLRNPTSYE